MQFKDRSESKWVNFSLRSQLPKGYKANFYKNMWTVALQCYKCKKLAHKNFPFSCVLHVQRPEDTRCCVCHSPLYSPETGSLTEPGASPSNPPVSTPHRTGIRDVRTGPRPAFHMGAGDLNSHLLSHSPFILPNHHSESQHTYFLKKLYR